MMLELAYPQWKIEKTEVYLRNLWNNKEKIAYSAFLNQPAYRQIENDDEIVEKAMQNILQSSNLSGFNIPRFMPDFGTVSTASYWGGETYKPEGGCIGIKHIIETASDIGRFKPSTPAGGDVERAVRLYKEVSAKLETNRLYSSFFDIQGPLNTAALLWKQDEFMMAMYSEPEAVHELLEQVTEHIIKIIKEMMANIRMLSGPMWPHIWLPTDIGVGITEDYMPLISPQLYKEFGIPYVERISEAFGGVFIHCCGEYEHQIENLKKSKINLLGMEVHYPHTRPEVVFNEFGSSVLFVPYISSHGLDKYPARIDYFKYLKDIRLKETRLWFVLVPEEDSFGEQVQIIESMRVYSVTNM